jgi:hypothetical protein
MPRRRPSYVRDAFRLKRGPVYEPRYVQDEPVSIERGIIYVIGEPGRYWATVFECPCGCRGAIWLNMLSGHSPRWRFKKDSRGKVSLSPSVNRTTACHSHFFLWKNQIHWCLSGPRSGADSV